jgi:hypothetical protein
MNEFTFIQILQNNGNQYNCLRDEWRGEVIAGFVFDDDSIKPVITSIGKKNLEKWF